jgi:hypothetical protein
MADVLSNVTVSLEGGPYFVWAAIPAKGIAAGSIPDNAKIAGRRLISISL